MPQNIAHGVSLLSTRGELPFVELNGAEINDTDHIIRELNTKFDKNLDSGLTPDQRIVTHAMESMLNNQTSWYVFKCSCPRKVIPRGSSSRFPYRLESEQIPVQEWHRLRIVAWQWQLRPWSVDDSQLPRPLSHFTVSAW